MTDSSDHILTLILDRLKTIEGRMDVGDRDASDSRKRMHERLENHGTLLLTIEHRVAVVEKAVESAAPTLKEYVDVKAKLAGAGLVGRKLWKIGTWLIATVAIIYGLRHDISAWWQWMITPK